MDLVFPFPLFAFPALPLLFPLPLSVRDYDDGFALYFVGACCNYPGTDKGNGNNKGNAGNVNSGNGNTRSTGK